MRATVDAGGVSGSAGSIVSINIRDPGKCFLLLLLLLTPVIKYR